MSGISGITGGSPQPQSPLRPNVQKDIADLTTAIEDGSENGMIQALQKLQQDDPTSNASSMIPLVENYGKNPDGVKQLLLSYVSFIIGRN